MSNSCVYCGGPTIWHDPYRKPDFIDPRRNQWTPQSKPKGTGVEIAPLVITDIEKRMKLGEATYGERLKAHNGRNAIQDAYEEALDLAIYLRQVLEETKE